jgi:curved DNA-binding protein
MIQWQEESEVIVDQNSSPEIVWTELQPVLGYYHLLGLEPHSSFQEVKQAYRRLARQFHPDLQPASLQKEAERRMMELNTAYDVLRNPERRAQYDSAHGIPQR